VARSSVIGERVTVPRRRPSRQEHQRQPQGRRQTSESHDVPYSNLLS
jgi:hypothetical protein